MSTDDAAEPYRSPVWLHGRSTHISDGAAAAMPAWELFTRDNAAGNRPTSALAVRGLLAAYDEVTADRDDLAAKVRLLEPFAGIFHRVEEVLDGALGTEDTDGTGEGVAADVALVVQQRDALAAKVRRARELADKQGCLSDDACGHEDAWMCAVCRISAALDGPAESTRDGEAT